jgi:hypothetical protein
LVRASDPVDAKTGLHDWVAFSNSIVIARATRWLKEHSGRGGRTPLQSVQTAIRALQGEPGRRASSH